MLKYLHRLLENEKAWLRRKRPDTQAGRIARAYRVGRVEAYQELLKFLALNFNSRSTK